MIKLRKAFFLLLITTGLAAGGMASAYESLAYLFASRTDVYINNVARTNGALTMVCPDYYILDGSGNLKITPSRGPDAYLVGEMHRRGIKVLPFISNNWRRETGRAAIANRVALAAQITAEIDSYGFDGISIDIENINHEDRSGFVELIREIRSRLPQGKLISVCAAANPGGISSGWAGAYDYGALANLCDHIFVMAYDESYNGSAPGPVAGMRFVRRSVEYAVKNAPGEKVMLGLPFYGRYWKHGDETGGAALTVSDIEGLVSRFSSSVFYDSENECARATVTIPKGEEASGMWGGKTLGPGTYDIWYDNPRSWELKFSLVKEYGLAGAGSWALGQEPSHIWSDYPAWLSGLPFADIVTSWAKNEIIAAYDKGLIAGTGGNKFMPEAYMTRAQAAVLLLRIMDIKADKGLPNFSDTRAHWAQNEIATAAHYNIVFGSPDGTFSPDKSVSRQEFALMLSRVANLPDTIDYNQEIYGDVNSEKTPWSNNAIIALSVYGIVSGTPEGLFLPAAPLTRAQAAALANRAEALPLKLPDSYTGRKGYIVEPH